MLKAIAQLDFRSVVSQSLRVAMGGALLLFLLLPATAFGDEPQKNVLLFQSDDTSLPANVLADRAIRSTLKEGWKSPIQIYDEGQDSFRIPTEDYEAELVNLLRRKYQRVHLDLIFAIGPPVLRFLVKHQSELFSNTPIVFLSTDQSRIAGLTLGANVTGVSTKVELPPTLELALALHPQTERVVVVAGNAAIDKGLLALAQKEFQTYEGRVAFTYLTDLTPEEVRQRLAVLPDKTIVMFLFFNADSAGRTYVSRDVVSQLAPTSRAPIYGSLETHLGHGIVGGRLLSYEALGVAAGKMGLRILAGESPQSIAPQTVPSVTMFDWRQLHRWGIDEAKLPPGSIVRFQEFSFWQLYEWRIVGAITLIVLQAVGILWLLFLRAKRRQAEEAKNNLAAIVETSDDAISSETLEGTITSWNAGAEKMYGYSAHEIVGQAVSTLAPPDLKGEVREILEHIRSGESVDHRDTVRVTREGRRIDVSLTVSPIKDNHGVIVGASTIARDMTDRNRSQQALQHLTGRLLMLQDEERRRVAGELHDGLGQNLAIIKNRAMIGLRDQTNQERAMEQLEEIASTATASILEVREIAHNLRPYELDRLGLVTAIESMIERVSDSTSIILSAALEPIDGLLSPETETSAYRIVQEGLTNIVKHSHATAARVEIRKIANQLVISVQDNGKGIPPPAPVDNGDVSHGFGLAGIAERVRVLGGTFVVDSEPSRGTTLTISLELRNGSEE